MVHIVEYLAAYVALVVSTAKAGPIVDARELEHPVVSALVEYVVAMRILRLNGEVALFHGGAFCQTSSGRRGRVRIYIARVNHHLNRAVANVARVVQSARGDNLTRK